jgi:zinc/manganese transport system permease protein
MHWVFEPGFFSNQPVQVGLLVGGLAAAVSGIVGVFVVVRGQSFAGHALTDVSAAGGSAAFLLGINPLLGFIGVSLIGAGSMDAIGVQRVRGRDLATGVVLGTATGLAALLLYLDTTSGASSGATETILFGSLFVMAKNIFPLVAIFSAATIGLIVVLYRPLLLVSTNPDLAAIRGVPVRAVGVFFMVTLAVAVGLSSLTVGTVLSTALLIGPPATALRITARIGTAIAVSAALGVLLTWAGIVMAYDSYYWSSSHQGYPVSFFIVVLSFVTYLLVGQRSLGRTVRDSHRGSGRAGSGRP